MSMTQCWLAVWVTVLAVMAAGAIDWKRVLTPRAVAALLVVGMTHLCMLPTIDPHPNLVPMMAQDFLHAGNGSTYADLSGDEPELVGGPDGGPVAQVFPGPAFPGGTTTGAIQYRSAGGTFAGCDRVLVSSACHGIQFNNACGVKSAAVKSSGSFNCSLLLQSNGGALVLKAGPFSGSSCENSAYSMVFQACCRTCTVTGSSVNRAFITIPAPSVVLSNACRTVVCLNSLAVTSPAKFGAGTATRRNGIFVAACSGGAATTGIRVFQQCASTTPIVAQLNASPTGDAFDIVNSSQVKLGAFLSNGGLFFKSQSNGRTGTGALSGGTLAVANTSVTVNSFIFVQDTASSLTNVGTLSVASETAGTGFTVTSSNALDTSTFKYWILETQ